jgi:hypothetical protein
MPAYTQPQPSAPMLPGNRQGGVTVRSTQAPFRTVWKSADNYIPEALGSRGLGFERAVHPAPKTSEARGEGGATP